MKDDMVFVDTHAGAGYSRLPTGELLFAPSFLALSSPAPFSRYILCEQREELSQSLKVRINKNFKEQNVLLLQEGPNELVEKLEFYLPKIRGRRRVTGLCHIDAFSMEVRFETMKKLADYGMNFFLSLQFPLNAFHNSQFYLNDDTSLLGPFLGEGYNKLVVHSNTNNELFYRNVIQTYKQQLEELGYAVSGTFQKVQLPEVDTALGYVAYCSRKRLSKKVLLQVEHDSTAQYELF